MTTRRREINLIIGGEAGQGMQTMGVLLARALLAQGYGVTTLQSYQNRIRGGHNYFQLRIAAEPVRGMTRGADIVVALDSQTWQAQRERLHPGTLSVFTPSQAPPEDAPGRRLAVPVAQLFPEAEKQEHYANTLLYGVLGGLLGAGEEPLRRTLERILGKKGEEVLAQNRAAFQAGWNFAAGLEADTRRAFAVRAPAAKGRPLFMSGNEAIAMGAIAAGCRFYAAYPMTPSSSILITLAQHMTSTGMVVEQAEDEIAAVNMVLGASYAGVRAMTGTSGGGFALMTEGLSLGGMLECPAVIALAMRPGPATGLPTRTEQGDLAFAVSAGHGEFPRAVLAPADPRECFALTVHAFNLADRFQTPIILLTDQYLADLYTNLPDLPLAEVKIDRGRVAPAGADYQRYALTPDGISPRARPGSGPGIVAADSDSHDEAGHLSEDLDLRARMTEKLLAKHDGLVSEWLEPEILGEHRENLVLCWGSTRGVVQDAVRLLAGRGFNISLMHFRQVWPLDGARLAARLHAYRNLVMVENNATGQLARLIRAETSVEIENQVLKRDGKPFLVEELAEALESRLHQ